MILVTGLERMYHSLFSMNVDTFARPKYPPPKVRAKCLNSSGRGRPIFSSTFAKSSWEAGGSTAVNQLRFSAIAVRIQLSNSSCVTANLDRKFRAGRCSKHPLPVLDTELPDGCGRGIGEDLQSAQVSAWAAVVLRDEDVAEHPSGQRALALKEGQCHSLTRRRMSMFSEVERLPPHSSKYVLDPFHTSLLSFLSIINVVGEYRNPLTRGIRIVRPYYAIVSFHNKLPILDRSIETRADSIGVSQRRDILDELHPVIYFGIPSRASCDMPLSYHEFHGAPPHSCKLV